MLQEEATSSPSRGYSLEGMYQWAIVVHHFLVL